MWNPGWPPTSCVRKKNPDLPAALPMPVPPCWHNRYGPGLGSLRDGAQRSVCVLASALHPWPGGLFFFLFKTGFHSVVQATPNSQNPNPHPLKYWKCKHTPQILALKEFLQEVLFKSIFLYVLENVCMYLCVWVCTCVHICVCVCLYVAICVCSCVCICVHMCLHACA